MVMVFVNYIPSDKNAILLPPAAAARWHNIGKDFIVVMFGSVHFLVVVVVVYSTRSAFHSSIIGFWVCVCVIIKFSSCTNAICLIKLVSTRSRHSNPDQSSDFWLYSQYARTNNDRRMAVASQKTKDKSTFTIAIANEIVEACLK